MRLALVRNALLAAVAGTGLAAMSCSDSGSPAAPPEAVKTAAAPEVAPVESDAEIDWSGGDPAKGRVLYAAQCAICHGDAGKGDGPASVATNPKPRDFTVGSFYFDATGDGETGQPADLALVIQKGPAAFGGSNLMIGWEESLSPDEIRDLVAFLFSLSG